MRAMSDPTVPVPLRLPPIPRSDRERSAAVPLVAKNLLRRFVEDAVHYWKLRVDMAAISADQFHRPVMGTN
jgi:hypothetical protein